MALFTGNSPPFLLRRVPNAAATGYSAALATPGESTVPQLILVALVSLLLGACSDGPPLVGTMTKTDLCRAVESALREQLDMFVITEGQECTVEVGAGDSVEVISRYKSPLGSKHPFVARGQFADDALELAEIQVEGVSDGFVPFAELGK